MKSLYVHCGLHKTGTTALQLVLFHNREQLAKQGFHYPIQGIPRNNFGHHNIAWQLSRDRRFRPRYGDIRALFSEFEKVDRNIIISSEDFECSLLHPYRWQNFNKYLFSNNIKITFIIYLRNRLGYLESLYFELLRAGFGGEYNSFVKEVFDNLKFSYKEWEFSFDYLEIANRFSEMENVEVIFKNYDSLIEGNIVPDFCKSVGLDHSKIIQPVNVGKINERLSLGVLLKLFIKNRNKNSALTNDIAQVIDELCKEVKGSLASPAYMQKEFKVDHYESLFDQSQTAVKMPKTDRKPSANIKNIFSMETHLLILNLHNRKDRPDIKSKLIGQWLGWIELNDRPV